MKLNLDLLLEPKQRVVVVKLTLGMDYAHTMASGTTAVSSSDSVVSWNIAQRTENAFCLTGRASRGFLHNSSMLPSRLR